MSWGEESHFYGLHYTDGPSGFFVYEPWVKIPPLTDRQAIIYWLNEDVVGVYWPSAYPDLERLPHHRSIVLNNVPAILNWLDLPARQEWLANPPTMTRQQMITEWQALGRGNWLGGRRTRLRRGLVALSHLLRGQLDLAVRIKRWESWYWSWQQQKPEHRSYLWQDYQRPTDV